MVKSLLAGLTLLITAYPAFAQQPGLIGLYGNEGGTSCKVTSSGQVTIHVIHLETDGATASEFNVNLPSCLVALGQTPVFALTQGDFWSNISISYQECLSGPIYLGSFFCQETGCSECTPVRVVPNSASIPEPGIWAVDCGIPEARLMKPSGGKLVVNPTAACDCGDNEETKSWGGIKALFD